MTALFSRAGFAVLADGVALAARFAWVIALISWLCHSCYHWLETCTERLVQHSKGARANAAGRMPSPCSDVRFQKPWRWLCDYLYSARLLTPFKQVLKQYILLNSLSKLPTTPPKTAPGGFHNDSKHDDILVYLCYIIVLLHIVCKSDSTVKRLFAPKSYCTLFVKAIRP